MDACADTTLRILLSKLDDIVLVFLAAWPDRDRFHEMTFYHDFPTTIRPLPSVTISRQDFEMMPTMMAIASIEIQPSNNITFFRPQNSYSLSIQS